MNLKIIIVFITAVLLAVTGALYTLQRDVRVTTEPEITIEFLEKEDPSTFGEEIYKMVQNPAEKIPQTNPFKTKINPFEGLRINPFK